MRVITALAAATSLAIAGTSWASGASDAGGSLSRYLQQALHVEGPAHFQAVDVDLDGDGVSETIAFIDEPQFCGTGGCDALILKRVAGGYRTVTKFSVTHLPIRVLPSRSHGWSDLGVTVVGGGVLVRLRSAASLQWSQLPDEPDRRTG